MQYSVRLKGLEVADGDIGIEMLRDLCSALIDGSVRALRLAVEGTSYRPGTAPGWVKASTDFTVSGIRSGSTILEIEAPRLGQTAADEVRQPDLWETLPKPSDTALTLLVQSIKDATDQRHVERLDRGMLSGLLKFNRIVKHPGVTIEVGPANGGNEYVVIGASTIESIERLKATTPKPHAIVVSGECDVIEHSSRRFQIRLDNGLRIRASIHPDRMTIEELRASWGKRVTVKGSAHFTPTGKPRFIEADVMRPFEPGDEVFADLGAMRQGSVSLGNKSREMDAGAGLQGLWGTWPGNESLEELLTTLKENK